ncbi:hypothetical protein [Salinivibrio kushneri]|nr:hypothetical protein [Salinivibrio kushneri]
MLFPYSVFRIPYSVFRIPYSVFRIPYSVLRQVIPLAAMTQSQVYIE